MREDDEDAVGAALAALGHTTSGAHVTRLKGLTNRVYKVELATERLCVRIPGTGTAEIIDRSAEEANARTAAAAGVAPEVLHFGADGVMVTRFIEAETMSPEHFCTTLRAVKRAATALRRLHETARPFARSFDLFGTIDRYRAILGKRTAELPAGFAETAAQVQQIRRVLEARPVEQKPCHCDPSGGNLLDTGERVLLIDWEYSGQNDPMWDLAYLSVEARFDRGQDESLLAAYFAQPPSAAEGGRLAIYKVLSQFLSALWAMIQHTSENRAADFHGYAERVIEDCRQRMRHPDFATRIDVLRSGPADGR
jgi:thiamine kinase-like enzyme